MDFFGSNFVTLLIVAIVAFILGRITAGRGESRIRRRASDLEAVEHNIANMSTETRTRIDDLVLKGRTIEAIKVARGDLGIGLREAKLTVDKIKGGKS